MYNSFTAHLLMHVMYILCLVLSVSIYYEINISKFSKMIFRQKPQKKNTNRTRDGDDDANCDGEATMCRAWWYKYSTTQKLIIYNWLDIASIIFWTGTISLLERYWEILNLESGDIKIIQIARLIAGSMCIGCNWFQCNQCTKKSCGINCGYDRKHTRKKTTSNNMYFLLSVMVLRSTDVLANGTNITNALHLWTMYIHQQTEKKNMWLCTI